MKPTKNIYYCHECHHTKTLFESESKALAFIKWNAADIAKSNEEGKAPCRAYYCTSCGGWHVTSSPVAKGCPTPSDRIISAMQEEKAKKIRVAEEKQTAAIALNAETETAERIRQVKANAAERFDMAEAKIREVNLAEACQEMRAGINLLFTFKDITSTKKYKQCLQDRHGAKTYIAGQVFTKDVALIDSIKKTALPDDMEEMLRLATGKLEMLLDVYYDMLHGQVDSLTADTDSLNTFYDICNQLPSKTEQLWQLKYKYLGLANWLIDTQELLLRYADTLEAS